MQTPNFNSQIKTSAFTRPNQTSDASPLAPRNPKSQQQPAVLRSENSAFQTARKPSNNARKSMFDRMIETGKTSSEDSNVAKLFLSSQQLSSIKEPHCCSNELSNVEVKAFMDISKQQLTNSAFTADQTKFMNLSDINLQKENFCDLTREESSLFAIDNRRKSSDVHISSAKKATAMANEEQKITSGKSSSSSVRFTSKEEFESSIAKENVNTNSNVNNNVNSDETRQPIRRRRRLADSFHQEMVQNANKAIEEQKVIEQSQEESNFKPADLGREQKARVQQVPHESSATVDITHNHKVREESKQQQLQQDITVPLHQPRNLTQPLHQITSQNQELGLRRRRTDAAQSTIKKPIPRDYKKLQDRDGKTFEFPVFRDSDCGLNANLTQKYQVHAKADDDCDTDEDVLYGALRQCQDDFNEFAYVVGQVRRERDLRNIGKNYEIQHRVKFPQLYDRNGCFIGARQQNDSLMEQQELQQHHLREAHSERQQ